jgi:hypothetical protein
MEEDDDDAIEALIARDLAAVAAGQPLTAASASTEKPEDGTIVVVDVAAALRDLASFMEDRAASREEQFASELQACDALLVGRKKEKKKQKQENSSCLTYSPLGAAIRGFS